MSASLVGSEMCIRDRFPSVGERRRPWRDLFATIAASQHAQLPEVVQERFSQGTPLATRPPSP
eukprot:7802144-Alexandrium_andersonii.AAC.1